MAVWFAQRKTLYVGFNEHVFSSCGLTTVDMYLTQAEFLSVRMIITENVCTPTCFGWRLRAVTAIYTCVIVRVSSLLCASA